MKKKKKKDKLCCELCGSTDVDMQAWVNVNTHKLMFNDGSNINYCNECYTEVYLTTVSEFRKNKNR